MNVSSVLRCFELEHTTLQEVKYTYCRPDLIASQTQSSIDSFRVLQTFSVLVAPPILSSPSLGGLSVNPSAPTAIKLSSSAFLLSSLRSDRSTATSSPNLAAISSRVRPTL